VLAFVVEQDQPVVVTAKAVMDQVADDQWNLLAAPLALRVLGSFSLSAAKPTQSGGAMSAAISPRMSGFCTSSIAGGAAWAAFLIFCVEGFERSIVGDRRDGDENVLVGDFTVHRSVHLRAR
jgi:hypothetical protein